MLKKYIYTLCLLALVQTMPAQDFSNKTIGRTVERVYITTDKDVYVAGDNIWCSAFCLDVTDSAYPRFSGLSNLVYLELQNENGQAQTAKIALKNGRGAGMIKLSINLPTGNYRLIAYTTAIADETDFTPEGKLLTIYNTLSTERLADENYLREKEPAPLAAAPQRESTGVVEIKMSPKTVEKNSVLPIEIINNSHNAQSLSVAIYHDDSLIAPRSASIVDFARQIKNMTLPTFAKESMPNFEGEIIRARYTGKRSSEDIDGSYNGYLSTIGDPDGVYITSIDSEGKLTYYTNTIYGNRDVVLEVETYAIEKGQIELIDPFLNPKPLEIPKLQFSKIVEDKIVARSLSMQMSRRFEEDTLFELLPMTPNPLYTLKPVSYILDDYTRFPLMEEDIREFIPEIRIRKIEKVQNIQVRIQSIFKQLSFSNGFSLVLLDGVPILDHSKIITYDPLLVQRIDVYTTAYLIGPRYFEGVVNFVTYKQNMPEMSFGPHVRIVNYQGASYPLAYTGARVKDNANFPDYRQTIYWHPLINLEASQNQTIECVCPSYSGTFRVVVQGLDVSGNPIYREQSFTIE